MTKNISENRKRLALGDGPSKYLKGVSGDHNDRKVYEKKYPKSEKKVEETKKRTGFGLR